MLACRAGIHLRANAQENPAGILGLRCCECPAEGRWGNGAVADYAAIRPELNPEEEVGRLGYHVSKTMPDADALAKYYATLTDAQLLNLRAEDGFTEQAELVLAEELKRRNLKDSDVKRNIAHKNRINLRDDAQEKGFKGRGPSLLFFGNRFLNEADKTANIRLRTKWFALGGMPIVPLASYRFKCNGTPGKWFWGTPSSELSTEFH